MEQRSDIAAQGDILATNALIYTNKRRLVSTNEYFSDSYDVNE